MLTAKPTFCQTGEMRDLLFDTPAKDPTGKRRRSGRVARKLRMLRAHGLIHKLPHSYSYMLSDKGAASFELYDQRVPNNQIREVLSDRSSVFV